MDKRTVRADYMKIAYVFNVSPVGLSGDQTQGRLLADRFGAIKVSSQPIPTRKDGYVEVDDGDFVYPCRSILSALKKLEPDLVFIHTFTPQLTKELQRIAQQFVTVVRLAVNFEELIVVPSPVSMLPHLWVALRQFDCIVAPSKWVKSSLNILGFDNVIHIPTTINTKDYKEADGKQANILSVGRIGPIKNHIVPLLAYTKIRREVPAARLTIIGNGPLLPSYKQMLQGMAMMGMGGLDGIQFTGAQNSFPFYKTARVYVQTSFSENGSITLLEALCSGVPVVASRIGGHLYDSEAIKFVRHDNVEEFANATIELLKDDDKWQQLHSIAMKDARAYDVDKVVKEQYEPLFERLVKLKKFKQR